MSTSQPISPNLQPTNTPLNSPTVPVSVITTCYGRNRHLYNLLTSLAAGSVRPAEVIIVNDDAEQARLDSFDLDIVQLATTMVEQQDQDQPDDAEASALHTGFDIGRNRNIGASCARFESLIFLDVDCIVAYDFIEGLLAKLNDYPEALLMGQPRYLTRPLTDAESLQLDNGQAASATLEGLSVLNPYRYNLSEQDPAVMKTQDYGAFWSLCFAITKTLFEQLGGFDTNYVGYGAEDTDLAFMARALNIDFYLTKDVAYHQQHSVHRPPLNHLSSMIINANRFYDKWQHWPMSGSLAQFAEMGLIDWEAEQDTPIIITRLPTAKEIADAHYPDAPFG